MHRDDAVRLRHMLDAAQEAIAFIRNRMRNRLIHAYFDIDLDRVWDTVSTDLPPLIAELEKVISSEEVTSCNA